MGILSYLKFYELRGKRYPEYLQTAARDGRLSGEGKR